MRIMSLRVSVEPELQEKLDWLCRKTGRTRSALVREALWEYVDKCAKRTWPEELFQFKPSKSCPRFESLRTDLLPDRDNIFGDNSN